MNNKLPSEIWATFSGMINIQVTHRFFACFADTVRGGVKTVHLLLHSTGGYVSDGIALYNYLEKLPINLITYNAGGVSSIAVIVFLAGKKRMASETSTFMLHKTHASPPAGATAAILKEVADSLNIDNDRTESILRKYIKMPEEKWRVHEHGNITVTAKETVDFALIHQLGDFSPPSNAQLFNI